MTYEAPNVVEIGKAEDLICGSGSGFLDADNETRMVNGPIQF